MDSGIFRRALCAAALMLACASAAAAAAGTPAVALNLKALTVAQNGDKVVETPYTGATLTAGAVVKYVIVATNNGGAPALHFTPSDQIPNGTQYVLGSADHTNGTPEFTLDGKTWSAHPTVTVKDPATGKDEVKPAPASAYKAVRWVTAAPLAPKASEHFSFEVSVK